MAEGQTGGELFATHIIDIHRLGFGAADRHDICRSIVMHETRMVRQGVNAREIVLPNDAEVSRSQGREMFGTEELALRYDIVVQRQERVLRVDLVSGKLLVRDFEECFFLLLDIVRGQKEAEGVGFRLGR